MMSQPYPLNATITVASLPAQVGVAADPGRYSASKGSEISLIGSSEARSATMLKHRQGFEP